MGYPYHELVPPAILLDHPGQTKEEFVKSLGEVHVSPITEFKHEDPWDSHTGIGRVGFRNGLESLADVLRLRENQASKDFQTPAYDKHGFILEPPTLHARLEPEFGIGKTVLINYVITHLDNKVQPPRIVEVDTYSPLEEGVFVEASLLDQFQDSSGTVEVNDGCFSEEKVYIEAILRDRASRRQSVDSYHYRLHVVPVTQLKRVEDFSSQEEVYKKWPQFSAAKRRDFSQTQGNFKLLYGRENFLWLQRDGKYYLDPETFNRIPASWKVSGWKSYGYTDLVLTAEAIRLQAWKLLSRRGLDHLKAFLGDFPEAKARYEQAVFDSYLSLAAKKQQMTVSEMLQMRLFPKQ